MDADQLYAELVEGYKSDVKMRAQWLSTVGMASMYVLNDVLTAVYEHDDEIIDFNKVLANSTIFVPSDTREITIENARTGEQVTYNWSDINLLIDGRNPSGMTESECVCPRIYDSHLSLEYRELNELVDLVHGRGELLPFWMDQPYSATKGKKAKPDTTTSWDRFNQLRTNIPDAVLPMAMAALDGIEESLSSMLGDSEEVTDAPNYREETERLTRALEEQKQIADKALRELRSVVAECGFLRSEITSILEQLSTVLKQKPVKAAIDACDKETVVTARTRLREYYKTYSGLAND